MKIYKESLDAMLSIVRQYTQQTTDMEIERRVYDIIENVRANGDAALREYSEKFDGVKLDDFKVDQSIIDAAWDNLPEDLKHALLVAKKNITEFHSREIEQGCRYGYTRHYTWSKGNAIGSCWSLCSRWHSGISIYHYDDCIACKNRWC